MNQYNEFQLIKNVKKAILQEEQDQQKLPQIIAFQIVLDFIKSKNMMLSQKYFSQECPFQKQIKERKDEITKQIKEFLKLDDEFKINANMSILENLLIYFKVNENNNNIKFETIQEDTGLNQIKIEEKYLQKHISALQQENFRIKEQTRTLESKLIQKFEHKYQEIQEDMHQRQIDLQTQQNQLRIDTKKLLQEKRQFQEYISEQKQIIDGKQQELSDEIYNLRNKQILTRSQQLIANIDPQYQSQLLLFQLNAPLKESDLHIVHKQLEISKVENVQLKQDIDTLQIQKMNYQEQIENLHRKLSTTVELLEQETENSLMLSRKFKENNVLTQELVENNKQLQIKIIDLQQQISEQDNKENFQKSINNIQDKYQDYVIFKRN